MYPFPFTRITLVTFVSFARHTRPASQLVKTLEGKIPNILEAPSPLFAEDSSEQIKRFTLQPQLLVLARGSGILSLLNPDGEVERLRHGTMELLRRNEPLHHELTGRGLNMPGINHSTVTRFRRVPPNLEKFLTAFDEIATETNFQPMQVREILLTSETKAYMRGGEILRRFRLADQ